MRNNKPEDSVPLPQPIQTTPSTIHQNKNISAKYQLSFDEVKIIEIILQSNDLKKVYRVSEKFNLYKKIKSKLQKNEKDKYLLSVIDSLLLNDKLFGFKLVNDQVVDSSNFVHLRSNEEVNEAILKAHLGDNESKDIHKSVKDTAAILKSTVSFKCMQSITNKFIRECQNPLCIKRRNKSRWGAKLQEKDNESESDSDSSDEDDSSENENESHKRKRSNRSDSEIQTTKFLKKANNQQLIEILQFTLVQLKNNIEK